MFNAQSTKLNCVCHLCKVEFHQKPSRVAAGKGKFCSRKCQRIYRNDPSILRKRFFDLVQITDGCHLWTGRLSGGYGTICGGAKGPLLAHRLAYEYAIGPIPDGLLVCHTCDNPPCVNPAHLFVGTNDDNMADMARKGRQAKGEKSGMAKLTEEDVVNIRKKYRKGIYGQVILAREFGVTHQNIAAIVKVRTWKHV